MKRGKKKINFSNRFIYFLITLGILAIVATGVYAYNSNPANPATFGHTANEIDFSSGVSNALFLVQMRQHMHKLNLILGDLVQQEICI